MEIITIPLFDDNYGYLIIDSATRQAAAVDPGKKIRKNTRRSTAACSLVSDHIVAV
jgi:hypothetical protein